MNCPRQLRCSRAISNRVTSVIGDSNQQHQGRDWEQHSNYRSLTSTKCPKLQCSNSNSLQGRSQPESVRHCPTKGTKCSPINQVKTYIQWPAWNPRPPLSHRVRVAWAPSKINSKGHVITLWARQISQCVERKQPVASKNLRMLRKSGSMRSTRSM